MFLCLTAVLWLIPHPTRSLEVNEDDILVGKLQYERDLERRISSLLLSIIGPERSKVTVSLDLHAEVTSRREEIVHSETTSQIIVLENGMQEENYDSGDLGKPKSGATSQAGSNITDETRTSKETITLPAGVIKKMVITLIVSSKVPDNLVEQARAVIGRAVGFTPDRGDVLSVEKVFFLSSALEPQEVVRTQSEQMNFWIGIVKFSLSAVLGAVFLFFLFMMLTTFRTLKQAEINAMTAQATAAGPRTESAAGRPEEAVAATLPGAPVSMSGMPVTALPGVPAGPSLKFGFLQEKSARALQHLIEREPIQTIALVLSYVPPDQAGVILQSLPPNVQSLVTAKIASITQMDPAEVNRIEADIKGKIDYVVGGKESLINILQNMEPEAMREALERLAAANPALSNEIRNALFIFDDLVWLDNFAIQQVARQVPVSELAIALKNASEEVQNKIFDSLTEGAAQLLRQELELMRTLPTKRHFEAQRRVVQVVRQLESQGIILIQKPETL